MTSDAGALLLGRADRRLGLMRRFAACFLDGRSSRDVEHTVERLVGQRVLGIALGYEDVNDHDELRHDRALAATLGRLASRRARCAALAGKSTLNRLEHAPVSDGERYHKIGHDPAAIEALLVDVFLEAHQRPPEEIVLDLDATDDPIHENGAAFGPSAVGVRVEMVDSMSFVTASPKVGVCQSHLVREIAGQLFDSDVPR